MTLFHLVVDAQPVLESFSPIVIVEEIMKRCKDKCDEIPVDVYTTEVD